jgi:hypothetical protein
MTVVISTIALLTVFGIPAIRAFVKSFETEAGVRGMINAALSNARAIAAKEQKYAGVRFQHKWQADGKGGQYMIFIIHDEQNTDRSNGFRAVAGAKPIKLPDNIGVMDLRIEGTDEVDSDLEVTNEYDLTDTTAFSIVFSPSGKLVIHDVWVRNRDGNIPRDDDIFNAEGNVRINKIGMFIQDGSPSLGLAEEPSRREFIIYDRGVFKKVNIDSRWTDYLKDLKKIHISPYTGRMID